ncbi:MAG: NUDIX hydrolase [Saprospiraceae bacterium]
MEENPWQTIDKETVYENPWIKVTHNNVLNPSGNPGIYGVVHFKNKAIAIVPLDENNNTWLVGQYRYTLERYSWEVPEGGGPLNDSPLASAKRELLEETGITAKKWIAAGTFHLSNSITDEEAIVFVAKDLTFGEAQPEETEELRVKKLPFQEVVEMVMNGDITDGLAVAAILKLNS